MNDSDISANEMIDNTFSAHVIMNSNHKIIFFNHFYTNVHHFHRSRTRSKFLLDETCDLDDFSLYKVYLACT